MAQPAKIIDLAELRRSCSSCTLQQLCMPAAMDAAEVTRLDRSVRNKRPLSRGELLYRQGEAMRSLYVSRDGAFKTTAVDSDGNAQVIGIHLAGELIGLDGFGSGYHQCDAEALQPASVCEMPLDRLDSLLVELPSLQRQVLRVVGRGRDQDQSHLEILGRRHADDRLVLFLHSLRERLRAMGQDPDHFNLPMSREDMASYLGLVLETVSRSLGRLQDDGLIHVRGRKLEVRDPKRLDALAHGTITMRDRG